MPENNEMNTVAVDTAAEAVTEAVETATETAKNTFSNQHPFIAAFGAAAGLAGSAVLGAWVTCKVCDWVDQLPDRWHSWRADVKAKKAAKQNKPIEVDVEQEENS